MKPPPPPVVNPPIVPPPVPPVAAPGAPVPPVPKVIPPKKGKEHRDTQAEANIMETLSRRESLASALFVSSTQNRNGNEPDEDGRAPLPNKTVLGNYTILSLLGRGGYGITYRARNNTGGNSVVIKEHIPLGMATREPGNTDVTFPTPKAESRFEATMSEFLEEITVLRALEYPGIVPIIDSFEANDTAYYVMPFITGTILQLPDKVSLNPIHKRQEAARLRRILISLLRTLEYLGQHKIVHRDIKPENILITKSGQTVLLDFGSARQLQPGRVFSNVFTPDFCAPEQDCARSDEQMSQSLSQQTDIYSLGATFYYLISHLMPPRAEMRSVSTPDPYKPLAKRPELQELYGTDFLEGIDRAMELEPGDRWKDAAAWRESLEQDRSSLSPHIIRKLKIVGGIAILAFLAVSCIIMYILHERRQMRASYNSGLNFTESILYDFSTELIDLPGSGGLRRRLNAGLKEYLAVLQDMPEGRYTRLDRVKAAAWFNIGCNYMAIGQLKDAKEALLHAESLESLISSKEPDDQRFRYELARTHLKLADLAVRMADYREGARHADSAVQLLEVLHRKLPDNPDYGSALGEALSFDFSHYCDHHTYKDRPKKLERVLNLYREQVKHFPRHLASYAGLGFTLYYCGRYAKDTGDFEAAERYLSEAMKIYTDLTDNYPYRLSLRRGLARTLYHTGDLFFYEAIDEEDPRLAGIKNQRSDELFDQYIKVVRELRGFDADNNEYLFLECRALTVKAALLLRGNKPNEAVNCCRILMEQIDSLFANEPDNKDYLSVRAAALCLQAVAHKSSGRHRTQATAELAEARDMLRVRVDASTDCPDELRLSYAETLAVSATDALERGKKSQVAAWLREADKQMSILLEDHRHTTPRQKRCLEHISRLKLQESQDVNKTEP